MSALDNYFAAQTDTRLARQQYETAGVRIELCQIKERRAECISQHQPLADYTDRPLTREELLEVINYVMSGRTKL
jgi:hypothetical protein